MAIVAGVGVASLVLVLAAVITVRRRRQQPRTLVWDIEHGRWVPAAPARAGLARRWGSK
jgi:hypothetical protein